MLMLQTGDLFQDIIEEIARTENITLVILPIIAFTGAIIFFLFEIRKLRNQRKLKEANLHFVKQYSKMLTPRIRLKFKPFLLMGVETTHSSIKGANVLDITGALYLMHSVEVKETKVHIDTMSIVNWNTGAYACFRIANIPKPFTALSLFEEKKWVKITRPPMTLMIIVIVALSIYDIIITVAMFEGLDPSFLGQWAMFGWYFGFFAVVGAWFIKQSVTTGYKGDCWYNTSTPQDVILEKPSFSSSKPEKILKTHSEVFEVDWVYHDNNAPGQYLNDLNAKDIYDNINETRQQVITEISASNTDLKTELEQLQRLYELKQIENAGLKDSIEVVRLDAIAHGMTLAQRTLSYGSGGGLLQALTSESMINGIRASIPLIVGGAIILFLINAVLNFLATFSPPFELTLIVIIVGLILTLVIGLLIILALQNLMRPRGVMG